MDVGVLELILLLAVKDNTMLIYKVKNAIPPERTGQKLQHKLIHPGLLNKNVHHPPKQLSSSTSYPPPYYFQKANPKDP